MTHERKKIFKPEKVIKRFQLIKISIFVIVVLLLIFVLNKGLEMKFFAFCLGIIFGFIIFLIGFLFFKFLNNSLKTLRDFVNTKHHKKSDVSITDKTRTYHIKDFENYLNNIPKTKINIACKSDVGIVRNLNEDSLEVIKKEVVFQSNRIECGIMIVADGMGGHAKGELASFIGTNIVSEELTKALLDNFNQSINPEKELKEAVIKANNTIQEALKTDPTAKGMGTTIVACLIFGNKLFVANAGDSKCYIINKKKIRQVTIDHSLVQQLVDRGELTKEEAREHPDKNVIVNVVGYSKDVKVDTFKEILSNEDKILLTSDGLTNELEDSEIKNVVLESENIEKACERLVYLANERGGHDNISVVIGECKILKNKIFS